MIFEHNFIKPEPVDGGYKISFWNRSYTTGNEGEIFSSITSLGNELLASPVTLNVYSSGEKCKFGKAITHLIKNEKDDEKTVVSAFESEIVVVNVCHRFEEDSCNDLTISVMPRGRSVAAALGIAPANNDAFNVDRIYIDFPLKKELLPYFQTYPMKELNFNKPTEKTNKLDYAGLIPEGGFYSKFKQQVYIGGDRGGIGVFFADDRAFHIKDKERAVELIDAADAYILRFNILDKIPKIWQDKGENNQFAIDLQPLKIKLGTILTPFREYDKSTCYRRNQTIDAWKKIYCGYDEFLSGKKNADGSVNEVITENRYDRLKKYKIRELNIHEKWNDIQNSPILTEATSNRLKNVISECHKRGIRVVPYFGYEISTLSPIWAECGEEIMRKETNQCRWAWYRPPYQRALNVCMASKWADILADGVMKLYDEYGFDGLYFDTMAAPRPCENELHGCGYRDDDGELRPTYPVWEIRRFLKKVYPFVKARGGNLKLHMFGAFNLSALSFCDYYSEGETFQGRLMRGEVDELPEDLLKAQFSGFDTGVPVSMIVYINEPIWTYRNAMPAALLMGCLPCPNDIEKPLELLAPIWDAFDSFPLADAEWKPYFYGSDNIKSSNEIIKVSSWETEDKILAAVASTRADFDAEAEITSKYPKIKNAITGELLSENGKITYNSKGFDFLLILAEK